MLPIDVSELESFLPHRAPAVWIHQVLEVDNVSGLCSVQFKKTASFADENSLLESSYVEWMAQAFGYVSAAQRKLGMLKSEGDLQQAFLAAIKNYSIQEIPNHLKEDTIFYVRVKATHVVGPVTLVEGSVEIDSRVLATAQLKLFAVPKS